MPDFSLNIIITLMLICTALNICWWLYGKTLSEVLPALGVVIAMLTTLFCFFIAFKILFAEVCNNFLSPRLGYMMDYGEFIPYAKGIAYILAGILTSAVAVLLYKNEGKMANSKYKSADDGVDQNSGSARRNEK